MRTSPTPPVRMIHLGLGNFFRAHQAWYTAVAPDADQWGIAAFTGRSPGLAAALTAQDGLYNLISRGPEQDTAALIGSVSAAHAGTDLDAWRQYWRRPEVAVVTLTVTEAAYACARGGGLDLTVVGEDLAALRADADAVTRTVPGRLVAGLAARRAAGGGPLAIVSCDNLPDNGTVTARVVTEFADAVDPALARWIGENVSYITTMVDRITPATTGDDLRTAALLTGSDDAAPVVTEPFSEWVLTGAFPAGRPRWEAGGAQFVADVAPHEQRKLWLLNGGHSLLAYTGSARGHQTVAEAVTDPTCRRWLEQWWDEAVPYLTLPASEVSAYRAALIERWTNPRMQHRLAQIATDGSQKIPIRVLPVLRLARADKQLPAGAIGILGAWIRHLRGAGAPVNDSGAGPFLEAASARDVLTLLDPVLGADDELVAAVDAELGGS